MRPIPLQAWLCAAIVVFTCSASLASDAGWEASAYKGWSVSAVTVEGVAKDMASEIRGGLALAITGGLFGRKRATFYPKTLEEDLRRCGLFMARRGYPYAIVTPRFDAKAKSQTVAVIFSIDKGAPVRVATVALAGSPPDLERALRSELTVSDGDVFSDEEMQKSANNLKDRLLREGYARTAVSNRISWRDSVTVDAVFTVEPGEVFYIGDIDITGTAPDVVPLVRKTINVKTGQRFEPSMLEDSQTNLRVLGLYRQVRVDIVDAAVDTVDMIVDLVERDPRTIEFALLWWTDERLHGSIRWQHRNLFKRGRGGSIGAQSSEFFSEAKVSAWWPSILWPRSRGTLTLGGELDSEDAFTQTTVGVTANLRWDFSLITIFRIGLLVADVTVEEKSPDVSLDTGEGLLTEASFTYERKDTDDWVTPAHGHFIRFNAAYAPPEPLSENSYVRVEPQASLYFTIFPRVIFATRLLLGAVEPIGTTVDVVPNRRFFSGGANSMRGFERRKLGPLDSAGNPIGGEAKIEGSFELRYPLFWRLETSTFVDYGQVWFDVEDVNGDIEFAVGQGLWIRTPVGPIRFDLGYRVTDFQMNQPRTAFHFSIGPAF